MGYLGVDGHLNEVITGDVSWSGPPVEALLDSGNASAGPTPMAGVERLQFVNTLRAKLTSYSRLNKDVT